MTLLLWWAYAVASRFPLVVKPFCLPLSHPVALQLCLIVSIFSTSIPMTAQPNRPLPSSHIRSPHANTYSFPAAHITFTTASPNTLDAENSRSKLPLTPYPSRNQPSLYPTPLKLQTNLSSGTCSQLPWSSNPIRLSAILPGSDVAKRNVRYLRALMTTGWFRYSRCYENLPR